MCWGLKQPKPTPLAITGKVKTIRLNQEGGCALVDDGTVSCWKGDAAPAAQAGVSGATALWLVGATGCAAVAGGALHCWGANAKQFEGQTDVVAIDWASVLHGDGTVGSAGDNASKLKPVPGLTDAVEIGSGCARKKDGTAVCWGDDANCRLGLAFNPDGSTKPVPMKGITDAVQILDLGKPCVVTAAGTLMCQGAYDGEYEYGCGDRPPREIAGISGIASVASGSPVCAIGKDGSVLCFTKGVYDEKDMKKHPATAVPGITGATQIAIGSEFACALDGAGAVWCWGDNSKGSLGTGDTAAQSAPVKVAL